MALRIEDVVPDGCMRKSKMASSFCSALRLGFKLRGVSQEEALRRVLKARRFRVSKLRNVSDYYRSALKIQICRPICYNGVLRFVCRQPRICPLCYTRTFILYPRLVLKRALKEGAVKSALFYGARQEVEIPEFKEDYDRCAWITAAARDMRKISMSKQHMYAANLVTVRNRKDVWTLNYRWFGYKASVHQPARKIQPAGFPSLNNLSAVFKLVDRPEDLNHRTFDAIWPQFYNSIYGDVDTHVAILDGLKELRLMEYSGIPRKYWFEFRNEKPDPEEQKMREAELELEQQLKQRKEQEQE